MSRTRRSVRADVPSSDGKELDFLYSSYGRPEPRSQG